MEENIVLWCTITIYYSISQALGKILSSWDRRATSLEDYPEKRQFPIDAFKVVLFVNVLVFIYLWA